MSITLTTAETFNPGHGHSSASYPEVKIVQVDHEIIAKRMVLHMQYGETISGDWIGSPDMLKHVEIIENFQGLPDGDGGWLLGTKIGGQWTADPGGVPMEPDPSYDLFMISQFASSTSTYLYDENARALYQYLLDEGIYVGAES